MLAGVAALFGAAVAQGYFGVLACATVVGCVVVGAVVLVSAGATLWAAIKAAIAVWNKRGELFNY